MLRNIGFGVVFAGALALTGCTASENGGIEDEATDQVEAELSTSYYHGVQVACSGGFSIAKANLPSASGTQGNVYLRTLGLVGYQGSKTVNYGGSSRTVAFYTPEAACFSAGTCPYSGATVISRVQGSVFQPTLDIAGVDGNATHLYQFHFQNGASSMRVSALNGSSPRYYYGSCSLYVTT